MPATTREADGSSRQTRVLRAVALMEEALQIIDDLEDYPEVGARLHGLVESLKGDCTA